MKKHKRKQRNIVGLMTLIAGLCLMPACGLDSVAVQSGEASFRTLLDLLLTDFTNQLADQFIDDLDEPDENGNENENGGGADNENGDGNGNGGGGLTDSERRGQELVADNCAACHGDDGASGFAPNIQGDSQQLIADKADGAGGHIAFAVTEQDIIDITAYMASFADNGDDEPDNPFAAGEALVANNCAVCHGPDGASGFAPNIQSATENQILNQISGDDDHPMYDLTDQDIEDIALYLGSL